MNSEAIKNIIEEFLKKMTVDFDTIDVVSSQTHPMFIVRTKDSGALIGNRGETLQALNHLVKKTVEKIYEDKEQSHFILDVNGYQERKIDEIKNKAKMLADRARMFKYDVEMSPMNAYERMIVHSTFSEDPEIDTESCGEGKFRRVVIRYRTN